MYVKQNLELPNEVSNNVRVMVKTAPGKQWDVAREPRRRVKTVFDAEALRCLKHAEALWR